jgi:DHA1 family bicyclomycin/chloramphenicol resistance-like MFS transporter
MNSKITLYYIIAIGSSVMAYFVFVAIAPILYMQAYGIKLQHYGLYQGFLALTYCICSFSNGYFIRKYGTKKCTIFCIVCLLIFVILSFGASLLNVNNPFLITFIMMFLSVGIMMPSNVLYPLMFDILPESKGKTSAILTFVKMVVLGSGIQIAISFYNGSFISLGITLGSIVSISLYYTYKLLITENEVTKLN